MTEQEVFESTQQHSSRFGIVSRLVQSRTTETERQRDRSYWSRQRRAGWIQTRRGALRARTWISSLYAALPFWTGGAVAGVIGALLAISLFFIPDPSVVAAPAEDVVSELRTPVFDAFDDLELEPTPAVMPALQPRLVSILQRTALPRSWNQDERVTLHARPSEDLEPNRLGSVAGDWNRRSPFVRGAAAFTPYATAAASTIPPTRVSAAATVDPDHAQSNIRTTGLSIEKSGPSSGSPGEAIRYRITVTNTNSEAVEEVIVRERVTAAERVQQVDPPAAMTDGELVWNLGRLDAEQQRELTVVLLPSDPGEIDTETRVEVVSPLSAWARVVLPETPAEPEPVPEDEVLPSFPEIEPESPGTTDAAPPRPFPELKLAVSPVGVLQQGETLTLTFTITNTGTATAEDVTLYVNLSGPIQHRFGESVKHHVTRLEPGESRQAVLRATAQSSGAARLGASLTLQGAEEETHELTVPIRGRKEGVSRSPFFDSDQNANPPQHPVGSAIDSHWTTASKEPSAAGLFRPQPKN